MKNVEVALEGREMNEGKRSWRWTVGKVNTAEDHIEIRFGNAGDQNWEQWLSIALVSPPKHGQFTVQFLLAANEAREQEMICSVRREIDFYLIEKQEDDPWAYARYHCGTAANLYSLVHWSFFQKGLKPDHDVNLMASGAR